MCSISVLGPPFLVKEVLSLYMLIPTGFMNYFNIFTEGTKLLVVCFLSAMHLFSFLDAL